MIVDVEEFEANPERFINLVDTVGEIQLLRGGQVVARLQNVADQTSSESSV